MMTQIDALDLSGPAPGLTDGAYVAQSARAFGAGRAERLTLWVQATGDAATALATIEFKVQGSGDGESWVDVRSRRPDGLAAAAVDQSLAVAAGATSRALLIVDDPPPHARVAARAAGGATKSGDRARAAAWAR